MRKLYCTINEAIEISGLSRTSIYEALKRGELTARKAGRRTLISFEQLEDYLSHLPHFESEVPL